MIREWLVFFGPAARPWRYLTPGGFGHVSACGYDSERQMWVFFNPRRAGLELTVLPSGDEADRMITGWRRCRPHILRVPQRRERLITPAFFSCTGAIKALLGVRCRSLTPKGLYGALIKRGAEPVEAPDAEVPLVGFCG